MNDKVSASPSEFMGLMRQAQDQATVENLPMVEPLQQILELDKAQFLHALGLRVGLPVVTMAAINNMVAALEIMPFRDMLRHECLLLREEGGELLLVLSDPFDQKLRQWADAAGLVVAGLNDPLGVTFGSVRGGMSGRSFCNSASRSCMPQSTAWVTSVRVCAGRMMLRS